MPQLDKVSFFPQLLYFFIIFFALYVFMAKFYLPAISRTLKVREGLFTGLGSLSEKLAGLKRTDNANYLISDLYSSESIVLINYNKDFVNLILEEQTLPVVGVLKGELKKAEMLKKTVK